MAFDRTDPADLAALKSEVEVDPIGMGYAAVIDKTKDLLELLNEPANNVGGETAARVFDVFAMLDAFDPTDLDDNQTVNGAANYVHILVELWNAERSITAYKDKFRSCFAPTSATVVALDAQNAALSRAEVLFGQGTIITKDDWFAARDS